MGHVPPKANFKKRYIFGGGKFFAYVYLVLEVRGHSPHIKFPARDPKSKAGLLWNKYVFLMKWKKLVSMDFIFYYFAIRAVVLCLCIIAILMKKNIVPR